MRNLAGKVCFISGGGSGIGKATTTMLLKEEAKVFVMELSEGNIAELEKDLGCENLVVFQGDVTSEESVASAFAVCREKLGPVDIMLNNAGLGIPTPDISTTDLAVYQKMVDVNMTGVFLCSREALKDMKERKSGHILTVISMGGQRTNAGAPLYCASKFGARGLNSGLADQILKEGIKVTDINPGPTNSNYWGDREVPREKFLSVEDVAEVIRFVVSAPEHMVIREINFDNIHWLAK